MAGLSGLCRRLAFITFLAMAFGARPSVWAFSDNRDGARWISLYDGNEAQFTRGDRNRVLEALNTLGIEYREQSLSRSILVKENQRALIQDLIAQIFTKSSRVSRGPS